ncbi:MAG: ATP synthase F1 subunit gamma [Saprospiraceae bacterium]|nr:ATP synthase F1 subunit gamma [Candidatus Vicinibacter proximus]MBL7822732.1 ATP synthase F1 subunit gamma [Saprospiraceae bacterium]MCC6843868.1 ATP synthase F1 subunit gamma [Saprospiraceae bacterium]HRG32963.1 ATP synthase F1 subunit gamma [Saprospiraceae bacterium]
MAANLKEVRNRIKSVISTQQITKAMKMVSAAKLRRAQQAIVQMRPYANKLNAMMKNIMSFSDGQGAEAFARATEKKNPLLVIITSDRGLCGAFNTNIIKLATKQINEQYSTQAKEGKLSFLFIGKKGFEYFRRRYPQCPINSDYVGAFAGLSFEKIAGIADGIMSDFKTGKVDQVEIFYGRFKNAATQFPEVEQYLPVPKVVAATPVAGTPTDKVVPDFLFEPAQGELLQELIPSILQSQLFKCTLDNLASELGARMTAMDKASENAEAMLGELKINYNKARQEAITKELSEIVGGAAALGG